MTRVIFGCGYLPDPIQACFGERALGLELEYVVEPRPMGTAGRHPPRRARARLRHVPGAQRRHPRRRAARRSGRRPPRARRAGHDRAHARRGSEPLRARAHRGRRRRARLPREARARADRHESHQRRRLRARGRRARPDRGRPPVSIERETFPALVGGRPLRARAGRLLVGRGHAGELHRRAPRPARRAHPLAAARPDADARWIDDGAMVSTEAVLEAPCHVAAGAVVAAGRSSGPAAPSRPARRSRSARSCSAPSCRSARASGEGAVVEAAVDRAPRRDRRRRARRERRRRRAGGRDRAGARASRPVSGSSRKVHASVGGWPMSLLRGHVRSGRPARRAAARGPRGGRGGARRRARGAAGIGHDQRARRLGDRRQPGRGAVARLAAHADGRQPRCRAAGLGRSRPSRRRRLLQRRHGRDALGRARRARARRRGDRRDGRRSARRARARRRRTGRARPGRPAAARGARLALRRARGRARARGRRTAGRRPTSAPPPTPATPSRTTAAAASRASSARPSPTTTTWVYGHGPLSAVARRFKSQLNENAKSTAGFGELPEADHNEIVGWAGAARTGGRHAAIHLADPDDPPTVRASIATTPRLIGDDATLHRVLTGQGQTRAARAFWLLSLLDHASVYTAAAAGVDPFEIDRIAELKRRSPRRSRSRDGADRPRAQVALARSAKWHRHPRVDSAACWRPAT